MDKELIIISAFLVLTALWAIVGIRFVYTEEMTGTKPIRSSGRKYRPNGGSHIWDPYGWR